LIYKESTLDHSKGLKLKKMDNCIVRSEDYLEKKADLLDALKFREE